MVRSSNSDAGDFAGRPFRFHGMQTPLPPALAEFAANASQQNLAAEGFAVEFVGSLLKAARLADASDIYAASGPRRLTMVTCAGPYDPDRGGYQNLAVVTARPTGSPEPRSPHS